jgi:hypothetical protein
MCNAKLRDKQKNFQVRPYIDPIIACPTRLTTGVIHKHRTASIGSPFGCVNYFHHLMMKKTTFTANFAGIMLTSRGIDSNRTN